MEEDDLNALQYRTRTTLSIIRHPLLPLLLSGIHHTANPLPQQRLSNSLASLLLDIPSEIFIPFLSAFYQTLISYWSSIPALRLDKYLYLVRVYVSHTFIYFSQHEWSQDLLDSWVAMTRGQRYSQGVLDPNDMKVSDGLRYHVLDVWIDGLVEATAWELNLKRGPLKPIQTIMDMGSSRTLKERAQRVISDERVSRLLSDTPNDAGEHELSDDEFIGFV